VRRNEFRLIRKYKYQFEISRKNQDFEKFYSEMYLPTMLERHKELAAPESMENARVYFRHGLLFKVKREGDWISGGVCQLQRRMVNFKFQGVKDADRQLMRQASQSAVYFAVIHWANQMGFEAVNFEGCRSFMTGLFYYKRKWGTSVSIPAHQYQRIWIKVRHLTPAVRRFFQDNPCIVMDKSENLYTLIVTEEAADITPKIEEKWMKQYMTPGLSGLQIRKF
jgi:hypothetical protein